MEDNKQALAVRRRWVFSNYWERGYWIETYPDSAAIVVEHRYVGCVVRIHLPEADPKLALAVVGDLWRDDMALHDVLANAASALNRRKRKGGRPRKPVPLRKMLE